MNSGIKTKLHILQTNTLGYDFSIFDLFVHKNTKSKSNDLYSVLCFNAKSIFVFVIYHRAINGIFSDGRLCCVLEINHLECVNRHPD